MGKGAGRAGWWLCCLGLQMDVGASRAANRSLRRGLQGVREHCKSSGDIQSFHKAAMGRIVSRVRLKISGRVLKPNNQP